MKPDSSVTPVADGLAFPNGMAVTADNATLIVAESYAEQLTAFDIADDGTLSKRRIWAATPGDHPDGIRLDAEGAVWYADVGNRHCVRVREAIGSLPRRTGPTRRCVGCVSVWASSRAAGSTT